MQDRAFRRRRFGRSAARSIAAQLSEEDSQGRVPRQFVGILSKSLRRPAPTVDGRLSRRGGEDALSEMPYEGGTLFLDGRPVLVWNLGHPRDYDPIVQGGRDETDDIAD